MHLQAHNWLSFMLRQLPLRRSVLEIGSRDVNGTARAMFANADRYFGIDLVAGEGVDQVADGSLYFAAEQFDTVLCMEVLEHTDKAREVCRNAYRHLYRGGIMLVTMAGVGREPHSAVDGGPLKEEEFYRNVSVHELRFWMNDFGLVMINTETPGDVYAMGVKL